MARPPRSPGSRGPHRARMTAGLPPGPDGPAAHAIYEVFACRERAGSTCSLGAPLIQHRHSRVRYGGSGAATVSAASAIDPDQCLVRQCSLVVPDQASGSPCLRAARAPSSPGSCLSRDRCSWELFGEANGVDGEAALLARLERLARRRVALTRTPPTAHPTTGPLALAQRQSRRGSPRPPSRGAEGDLVEGHRQRHK
jgi:hypothetical protein